MHGAQALFRGESAALGCLTCAAAGDVTAPELPVFDFAAGATDVSADPAEFWAAARLSERSNEIHRANTCKSGRIMRSHIEVRKL
jgi:hypothetical protein